MKRTIPCATTKTQCSQINKYTRIHTQQRPTQLTQGRKQERPAGQEKCYQATLAVVTAGKRVERGKPGQQEGAATIWGSQTE